MKRFAYGGAVPDYEAEHGEVIVGDNVSYTGGKQLASNLHKIEGKTHEQANPNTINGTGEDVTGGDFVFSTRLTPDGKTSFAGLAELLAKRKAKAEKKVASNDYVTNNTGKLLAQQVDQELQQLATMQETIKDQMGIGQMRYGGIPQLKGGGRPKPINDKNPIKLPEVTVRAKRNIGDDMIPAGPGGKLVKRSSLPSSHPGSVAAFNKMHKNDPTDAEIKENNANKARAKKDNAIYRANEATAQANGKSANNGRRPIAPLTQKSGKTAVAKAKTPTKSSNVTLNDATNRIVNNSKKKPTTPLSKPSTPVNNPVKTEIAATEIKNKPVKSALSSKIDRNIIAPKTETVATNTTKKSDAFNPDVNDVASAALIAGNYLSNRSAINKMNTSVPATTLMGQTYGYTDQSTNARNQVNKAVNSVMLNPYSNNAQRSAAFAKGIDTTNEINQAELNRKRDYDNEFASRNTQIDNVNAQTINEAKKQQIDNENTQRNLQIDNNNALFGNLNSFLAGRADRKGKLKSMALLSTPLKSRGLSPNEVLQQ